MTANDINIDFLKSFIENNPKVLEKMGISRAGRPKGAKNKKETREIQVPNGLIRNEQGEVVKELELSKTATKQLVEQIMPKKKREWKNPETAEKMRLLLAENRKKGMEVRKKLMEDRLKEQEANTTIIKVKPKRGKRSIQRPDEEVSKPIKEQSESESESEEEIVRAKKKVDKKKAILDEIDNELKKLPPPSSIPTGKYSKYLGGW